MSSEQDLRKNSGVKKEGKIEKKKKKKKSSLLLFYHIPNFSALRVLKTKQSMQLT